MAKETIEKSEMEIFDTWIQSQKAVLDTWVKMQKDFFSSMAESSRKIQEAAVCPGCGEAGREEQSSAQQESIDSYNKMVEAMLKSSRTLTNQAMEVQDAWQNTVKKQAEINMSMARNFFELGKRAQQGQQGRQGEGQTWQEQAA